MRHDAVSAVCVADGLDHSDGIDANAILQIVEFVEEGIVLCSVGHSLL